MINQRSIAAKTNELAKEGFNHAFGSPTAEFSSDDAWRAVRETGTRLWLDTGDLDEANKLWNTEFEALTTNNTLLNKEIQKGIYDGFVGGAAKAIRDAAPDLDERGLLLEIAFVLNARHGLALVDRFDAFVSVELHTDLARDVERTMAYGRRFHAVCPERFIVKVPLSPEGLVGARRLSEEGIPINFTLAFSARQNVLAALVAKPAFGNVFMGRLNAFVADNDLGDGRNVGEKATLAAQRELRALRATSETNTQLIGASMRGAEQVKSLAGLDVFTLPTKVAAEYHGKPVASVSSRIEDDPEVVPAPGLDLDSFGANALWDVPEAFKTAAREIGALDPARLTPEEIVDRLRQAGFGDLFPNWSVEDERTAATDGKIPVYAHWKERLAAAEIGLDALMNLSAYHSFVSDQAALDARIKENVA